MARQRVQSYQYETSPRKLQPEYTPVKNPKQQKKKSTAKKVEKVEISNEAMQKFMAEKA